MRTFIALPLPEGLCQAIETATQGLRAADVKWASADGLHVTLAFLGDTSPERLTQATRAVDEAAERAAPFSLALEGAGTFGSPPRVLWLGVAGALDAARTLQHTLATALNVKDEHGGWSPHLTLARARPRHGDPQLTTLAQQLQTARFGPFAAELVLFESAGGRYSALHRAPLRGPGAR